MSSIASSVGFCSGIVVDFVACLIAKRTADRIEKTIPLPYGIFPMVVTTGVQAVLVSDLTSRYAIDFINYLTTDAFVNHYLISSAPYLFTGCKIGVLALSSFFAFRQQFGQILISTMMYGILVSDLPLRYAIDFILNLKTDFSFNNLLISNTPCFFTGFKIGVLAFSIFFVICQGNAKLRPVYDIKLGKLGGIAFVVATMFAFPLYIVSPIWAIFLGTVMPYLLYVEEQQKNRRQLEANQIELSHIDQKAVEDLDQIIRKIQNQCMS